MARRRRATRIVVSVIVEAICGGPSAAAGAADAEPWGKDRAGTGGRVKSLAPGLPGLPTF